MAVGEWGTASSDAFYPLVERWNGSRWSIQPTPPLRGIYYAMFNDVSCSSPRSCTSVGEALPESPTGLENVVLVEHWNGSTWSVQRTPLAHSQVPCASDSACMAIAPYGPAERWDGKRWSVLNVRFPPGANPSLTGVSQGGINRSSQRWLVDMLADTRPAPRRVSSNRVSCEGGC